jgi:hypothetical protein
MQSCKSIDIGVTYDQVCTMADTLPISYRVPLAQKYSYLKLMKSAVCDSSESAYHASLKRRFDDVAISLRHTAEAGVEPDR